MSNIIKAANVLPDDLTAKELDQDDYITKDRDGAIPAEILQEAIDLRVIFERLYDVGVISAESEFGIHLTEESFLATFQNYKVCGRGEDYEGTYPEELSAEFNGVRFFCVR